MHTPQFVVITGTDTGVGKTWVACRLARELVHAGLRVVAVKPLETGCSALENTGDEDGARLAAATGQREPTHALERLRVAVAPAEAADRESRSIDFDDIVGRVRALGRDADVVLVEGAGGLLAPLTWDRTIVDLARALGAPALVVAADRLGTINHTRMTLEVLRHAVIEILAIVVDAPPSADASTGSNVAAIRRYAEGAMLHEVKRGSAGEDSGQTLGPLATLLMSRG